MELKKYKLIKPVVIEIKYLITDQAKENLLQFGIELRDVLRDVRHTDQYVPGC